MDKVKTIEFIVPEWAICALVNDDYDCLEDQDILDIKTFIKRNKIQSVSPTHDEPYFRRYNDVNNLGANCYDCIASVG